MKFDPRKYMEFIPEDSSLGGHGIYHTGKVEIEDNHTIRLWHDNLTFSSIYIKGGFKRIDVNMYKQDEMYKQGENQGKINV